MGKSIAEELLELADRLLVVGPDRVHLADDLRRLAARVELTEETLAEYAVELMQLRGPMTPTPTTEGER